MMKLRRAGGISSNGRIPAFSRRCGFNSRCARPVHVKELVTIKKLEDDQ